MTQRDSKGRFCKCGTESCDYSREKKKTIGIICIVAFIGMVVLFSCVVADTMMGVIKSKSNSIYTEGKSLGYSQGYNDGVAFADNYTNCTYSDIGEFTTCDSRKNSGWSLIKFDSGYSEEVKDLKDITVSHHIGGHYYFMMPSGTMVVV